MYDLQETYPYYDLPFCKPEHGIGTRKKPSGIGEILEGNELRNSGLKLHFASTHILHFYDSFKTMFFSKY